MSTPKSARLKVVPTKADEPIAARIPRDLERLAYRPGTAARCIEVSRSQIYELIRSKRLRARKLGGSTLVLHSDLVAFLESLPEVEADREATS